MSTLIVYDSQFGNTERIAQAMAARLGSARLIRATELGALPGVDGELLIVGGPTQRQRASPAIRALLDDLPRGTLSGLPAAAFGTRYRMSRFLTGSCAVWIAGKLTRAGARLVAPPESFFMERDVPPPGEKRRHELERLEPGEEERAGEWVLGLLRSAGPLARAASQS